MRLAYPLAVLLLASVPALAQLPQRLRADVVSLTGETLVVHSRDGETVTVQLPAAAPVMADARSTAAAIKPGSTLGIVSRGPADKQEAVAIRVVPTGSMSRMGAFPWDMMPQSTMTNGVVEGESVAADGQQLTVKAGDAVVHMAVARDAVVAESTPGDRTMLTPGAHVVVFVTGDAPALTARAVVVGRDGFVPPL